jgi:conjugative transfer signal peptidase TraF
MIRRRSLRLALISGGLLATIVAIGGWGGLRFNLTPSYPLGLWRIVPLHRAAAVGDLVFVCPPRNAVFEQAAARGYLRRGLCLGWIGPLIKMVAAGEGQHVEVGRSVVIDGRSLAHSDVRSIDGEGRALTSWSGGLVPPGHLYLHSSFVGSYDSRYFGPVPAVGVLGRAMPVLTVDP